LYSGHGHVRKKAQKTESLKTATVVSVIGLASYLGILFLAKLGYVPPIVDRSRGAAGEDKDGDLTGVT